MYKGKDRKTGYLFEELFPFGGKLDENNRWLRICGMIPWEELEKRYASYFSERGRPALDGRLVIGLLILKHISGLSDEEVVQELRENPYWQALCGFEHFVTEPVLDDSSLSKLRKRLGLKYVKELEEMTYKVLIDRKIIKAKGMLVDATVFPESIKYPTDVGLLNDVREWLVGKVKGYGKRIGKGYRTYCRKARHMYMKFSKNKRKTMKQIQRAKKQMLQYVHRNLNQFNEIVEALVEKGEEVKKAVTERLQVAKEIYRQQVEMYKENKRRIDDRIVSFSRSYVRPIKQGKNGKDVEFGPKAAVTLVDGIMFVDEFNHDNFCEANTNIIDKQIDGYEGRFNKKPPSFTGDRLYGTRGNRALLEEREIRVSFKRLGRKPKNAPPDSKWLKDKQRERNRIEGQIGHGKEHFGLDRIRYKGREGSEMNVRLNVLGMNLMTILGRV